jgi:transposase
VAPRALSRHRKKGAREGRTLVFIDEAGFYLLPAVVATYAPIGETPVLPEMVGHEHLSVISAVTPQGELRTRFYEKAITGAEVVRFLQHLSHRLPGGRFWIFWDGAPIHRGEGVKQFLARVPAGQFRITPLPGYAPELNPDEGVWDTLKNDELANVSCLELGGLGIELRAGVRRLQRHPEVVRGFFKAAGYR